jgi:aminoglycoside phosphotransferase (APT) family kinase protein
MTVDGQAGTPMPDFASGTMQREQARHIAGTTLERLLREALQERATLRDWRLIVARQDYAVVEATLDEPAIGVVVKLAGPGAVLACPFERTIAIIRLVREQTQVPTFEALAADVSYRRWPWRYLVMSRAPGITWAGARAGTSTAEMYELRRHLGAVVAELHTVRFPACGEIDGEGIVAPSAPLLDALAARARRRIADPRRLDVFLSALDDRSALFGGLRNGTLCHEDLNPNNILVAQQDGHWRVTAILDFDSTWSGSGESDLARLELWRGMKDEGFHEAYRAVEPVGTRYPERRPIYQLLWCLEYARATPRHLADTAAVCAELGIAPVAFSG